MKHLALHILVVLIATSHRATLGDENPCGGQFARMLGRWEINRQVMSHLNVEQGNLAAFSTIELSQESTAGIGVSEEQLEKLSQMGVSTCNSASRGVMLFQQKSNECVFGNINGSSVIVYFLASDTDKYARTEIRYVSIAIGEERKSDLLLFGGSAPEKWTLVYSRASASESKESETDGEQNEINAVKPDRFGRTAKNGGPIKILPSRWNVVANQLSGEWAPFNEVTQMLVTNNKRTLQSSTRISFTRDDTIVRDIPVSEVRGARLNVYGAWRMHVGETTYSLLLCDSQGSPGVLIMIPQADDVISRWRYVTIAVGSKNGTDILFWGGGAVSDCFRAYKRAESRNTTKQP